MSKSTEELRTKLPICHTPKCPANYVGQRCDCELGDLAMKIFDQEISLRIEEAYKKGKSDHAMEVLMIIGKGGRE